MSKYIVTWDAISNLDDGLIHLENLIDALSLVNEALEDGWEKKVIYQALDGIEYGFRSLAKELHEQLDTFMAKNIEDTKDDRKQQKRSTETETRGDADTCSAVI